MQIEQKKVGYVTLSSEEAYGIGNITLQALKVGNSYYHMVIINDELITMLINKDRITTPFNAYGLAQSGQVSNDLVNLVMKAQEEGYFILYCEVKE